MQDFENAASIASLLDDLDWRRDYLQPRHAKECWLSPFHIGTPKRPARCVGSACMSCH